MITVLHGDALAPDRGVIVHGCNCMGVMGGGIALQVRQHFPTAYAKYREVFETEGLKLGTINYVIVDHPELVPKKIIVNAMTQREFGSDKRYVNYEAVATAFEAVNELLHAIKYAYGVTLPVIFPQIGAGLAGGNWAIIETIIDQTVSDEFEKICYVYP